MVRVWMLTGACPPTPAGTFALVPPADAFEPGDVIRWRTGGGIEVGLLCVELPVEARRQAGDSSSPVVVKVPVRDEEEWRSWAEEVERAHEVFRERCAFAFVSRSTREEERLTDSIRLLFQIATGEVPWWRLRLWERARNYLVAAHEAMKAWNEDNPDDGDLEREFAEETASS